MGFTILKRINKTAVRRKLEFPPVEGDIVVEKKREAKTNRGRKLLEAMWRPSTPPWTQYRWLR